MVKYDIKCDKMDPEERKHRIRGRAMGKYLPVIVTADCGSLTRAAQTLGYTQPSLGYIINNMEEELGVKLFFRSQRGVTLTDVGERLLQTMRRIEDMEAALTKEARMSQEERLRLSVIPSVASQWLPGILAEFYREHPNSIVQLKHQFCYLDGEVGVKAHEVDCAFFAGICPAGLDLVPLYEDPYCLLVHADSELARMEEVSLEEVVGKYPFIPNPESFDRDSAIYGVYRSFDGTNVVECEAQEYRTAVAMVEAGLGITLLPGLDLPNLSVSRAVRVIPLKEKYTRTIGLLCPKGSEMSALTADFLRLTKQRVDAWKQETQI